MGGPTPAEVSAQRAARPHVVYIAWADGQPLYVGCTVNLAQRLRGHELTGAAWPEQATHVDFFDFPNKASALEVERATIRALQPTYNVRSKVEPLRPWAPRVRVTPPQVGLRAARKSLGVTKAQMLTAIGFVTGRRMTEKRYSRIERGREATPPWLTNHLGDALIVAGRLARTGAVA